MREALVTLRFGPARERSAALAGLRVADRSALSQVVIHATHGGHNLGLADTVAGYLLGSDRTPDDRRRGAEYRLVILPVALGAGLPLFKDLPRPLRLDLAETRSFSDGRIINVYQPPRTEG